MKHSKKELKALKRKWAREAKKLAKKSIDSINPLRCSVCKGTKFKLVGEVKNGEFYIHTICCDCGSQISFPIFAESLNVLSAITEKVSY